MRGLPMGFATCLATCLSTFVALAASGCGNSTGFSDAGGDLALPPLPPPTQAQSKIEHLIVIVQENHTFDNYFARYCTAKTGSAPACTEGPACCEAGPEKDPGSASAPIILDDNEHAAFDPDHSQSCELLKLNGGKMDAFVTAAGSGCGSARNFAYGAAQVMQPYWDLAAGGALADHYFQPMIGASSGNDMYLVRAQYVFTDNQFDPESIGQECGFAATKKSYIDPTIADLLKARGATYTWYIGGYQDMVDARAGGHCPQPPDACPLGAPLYPCTFEPGDVPIAFYPPFRDKPASMRDLTALSTDLASGRLPQVVFVKEAGYLQEHPGYKSTMTDGMNAVRAFVAALKASSYAKSTLLLLTYDEGGGYFDHISPPAGIQADKQAYGTRVPLLALGPFARKNHISHAVLEHSSIVKFIEWNWLDGKTGGLDGRDATVANLGSLLDPAATGTAVPE